MFDLKKLASQAKSMQADVQRVKDEAETHIITIKAGGDLIEIQINGNGMIQDIDIDPSLLATDKKVILQDVLKQAITEAQSKASHYLKDQMAKSNPMFAMNPFN
jgi:DNA-binding YbaB/EbfC family protein